MLRRKEERMSMRDALVTNRNHAKELIRMLVSPKSDEQVVVAVLCVQNLDDNKTSYNALALTGNAALLINHASFIQSHHMIYSNSWENS